MNTISQTTITIPLSGVRPLYRNDEEKTLVCEIDVEALKNVNEPQTIEEMVAESRMNFALGNHKTFTDAESLISELNS